MERYKGEQKVLLFEDASLVDGRRLVADGSNFVAMVALSRETCSTELFFGGNANG